MKTHTTLGAATLQAALKQHPGAEFLQMASQIALTHHERFDGTGYPAGLKGQDIPLSGRIMAIADVYDALTSKRVYKPAFDHLVARSIIQEGSGHHFDPVLVEAFHTLESQFSETRASFSDVSARAA
jgi:putative two-component system response regulator